MNSSLVRTSRDVQRARASLEHVAKSDRRSVLKGLAAVRSQVDASVVVIETIASVVKVLFSAFGFRDSRRREHDDHRKTLAHLVGEMQAACDYGRHREFGSLIRKLKVESKLGDPPPVLELARTEMRMTDEGMRPLIVNALGALCAHDQRKARRRAFRGAP